MNGRNATSGLLTLCLAALFVPCSSVWAQDGGAAAVDSRSLLAADARTPAPKWLPKLKATVKPARAHVGDPISVVVSVTHNADVSVNLPLKLKLGEFTELSRSEAGVPRDPQHPEAGRRRTFTVKVGAYKLGKLTLPPIELSVLGPHGAMATLKTEAMPIRIVSVMANEPDPKLKEAEDPVPIYRRRWWPLYVLFGLLALIIAIVVTLIVYRRVQARKEAVVPVVPEIPAHVIAMERLEQLEVDRLIAASDFKTLYTELSVIMRDYIGRRFGFDALEMTTTEINAVLQRFSVSASVQQRLGVLLGECDLVKFAKFVPDAEVATGAHERAHSIVQDTMPPPAEMEPQS